MCVYVSVYVRLCDHNMWHDVFLYGHNSVLQYMTRHIPMWTRLSPMCVMVTQYVTWPSPKTIRDTTIWDTTYSHMWHDSVLYVLWLSPMCGNSFLCITYMWYNSFHESWRFVFVSKCIWLSPMCVMTQYYVWHDSFRESWRFASKCIGSRVSLIPAPASTSRSCT